jgi:hypothetical protein
MVTVQKITNRNNGKVSVTFTMTAMEDCGCLYLVGNFSGCNESVYCMNRTEDGAWSLTLELDEGHEYLYRFRTLDGTWLENLGSFFAQVPLTSMAVSTRSLSLSTL